MIHDYEQDYYDLRDEYEDLQTELEDVKADLQEYENCNDPIKDSEKFIEKLKLENLYSEELKDFIEKYMKFYND